MDPQRVRIELSGSEALVLCSWLNRFNESGDATFEDQAEERVFWDLECSLERLLGAPLRQDHQAALRDARNEVRDPGV